jgi:hypothetical protein
MDSGAVIYITSFMMTGTSFQAILKLSLNDMNNYEARITDGMDLCCVPWRWATGIA